MYAEALYLLLCVRKSGEEQLLHKYETVNYPTQRHQYVADISIC